jgi:hypothetical protein
MFGLFGIGGRPNSIIRGEVKRLMGVVSPSVGSVVYCDLAEYVEHTGIYIGDNKIVHLDGSGIVEVVTPKQFMGRLNGFNSSAHIYVSCKGKSAVGGKAIAERAKKMVGSNRRYNILLDNCHQFTSGCITGNFENSDNFLWMLKHTAKNEIGVNKWLIWDDK